MQPIVQKRRQRAEIRKFIKRFSTFVKYRNAVSTLCQETLQLFNASGVILLLETDSKEVMEVASSCGFPNEARLPSLTTKDPLWHLLHHSKQSVEIRQDGLFASVMQESPFMRSLASRFSCRLIIRLTFNGKTIGALLYEIPATSAAGFGNIRPLLTELGERAGVTLRHARLLRSLKRESQEKDLLLEIGRKINSTLNLDELLNLILDSLQQVVHYDKAAIFLVDHRTKIIGKIARRGPDNVPENMLILKVLEGLCAWVLNYLEPVVVEDVSQEPRYYALYPDTQSEMDVPIISRESILGVFSLESNTIGAFSRRERRLVQALAGQAAIAIENARLLHEMLEKRELERDLRTARRFQRALLPRTLPQVSGYDFAAINVPSQTVGGDLYDFIQFSDGRIGISIGDVAGKGTPGAIIMAMLYSTYRGLVRQKMPMDKMMHDLNNLLKKRISPSSFVTFFYGELNPASGEFVYCNAGHCGPFLLRSDGRVEKLTEGGLVLGFLADMTYEVGRTQLQAGDLLLLYTDGVTEAMPLGLNEIFDESRLLTLLRENRDASALVLLRHLYHKVKAYTGSPRLLDDLTAVAVKVTRRGGDAGGPTAQDGISATPDSATLS